MSNNVIWLILVCGLISFDAQSRAIPITLQDTLIVNLDETFGKYINHKVEAKQTLFSLANAYHVDLYDVYDYNPILKSRVLFANDVLRIPLSTDLLVTESTDLKPGQNYSEVIYIVRPKDNLYRISKIYFNMSFEDLMQRNKLANPNVKVGQRLLIGWFDPSRKTEDAIPDFKPQITKTEQNKLEKKWTEANPTPFTEEYKAIEPVSIEWADRYKNEENSSDRIISVSKPLVDIHINKRKELSDESASDKNLNKSPIDKKTHETRMDIVADNPNVTRPMIKSKILKRRMVTQNGVAQWSKNGTVTTEDLYVLHPSAPINSVVELSNPMTHRTIYAKVLSNMPPKLYADDVTVVVSPGVANLLGAIDGRFYVKLRFVEETIQ